MYTIYKSCEATIIIKTSTSAITCFLLHSSYIEQTTQSIQQSYIHFQTIQIPQPTKTPSLHNYSQYLKLLLNTNPLFPLHLTIQTTKKHSSKNPQRRISLPIILHHQKKAKTFKPNRHTLKLQTPTNTNTPKSHLITRNKIYLSYITIKSINKISHKKIRKMRKRKERNR